MKTKFFGLHKVGILVLMCVAVIVIKGCKKENPGPNQVVMQNTAFNPSSITVSKNATVTWTNNDNMTHNVTSDSGLFVSGNIPPGSTYSHQFTATGTYPYRCTIHVGMTGTVIVQ
jgi:plastocyanin